MTLAMKGAVLLVAVFLIVKFGLPLITAPLPMSLIWLYLFLTTVGIVVYGTLSAESTEALLGPIFRFLGGEGLNGSAKLARLAVLVLVPLLVGWQTSSELVPSSQPPAENRTIHPAPPGEFVGLANPGPNTRVPGRSPGRGSRGDEGSAIGTCVGSPLGRDGRAAVGGAGSLAGDRRRPGEADPGRGPDGSDGADLEYDPGDRVSDVAASPLAETHPAGHRQIDQGTRRAQHQADRLPAGVRRPDP